MIFEKAIGPIMNTGKKRNNTVITIVSWTVVFEMLWGEKDEDHIASEESIESVDIFETAMKNCFYVGKPLIDDILAGSLLFRN